MTKKIFSCILALIILSILTVSPVLAASINGTFGMTAPSSSQVTASTLAGATLSAKFAESSNVTFGSIENVGHLAFIGCIVFDPSYFTGDAGRPNSSSTRFTSTVGPGEVGYQRVFSGDGSTYLYGFAYVTFDNFQPGGLTGYQVVRLVKDDPYALYNLTMYYATTTQPTTSNYYGYLSGLYSSPASNAVFTSGGPGYVQNRMIYQYANIYQANTTTNGIQGYIQKFFYDTYGNLTVSPSKAWVTNNNDNTLIAGDTSSTLNTLNFNSVTTRDITLTMQDPTGAMWNQTFGGLTNFTLSANPSTINPNQTTVVSLTSSLLIFSGYNYYSLQCSPLPGCKSNGTEPSYYKYGQYWYQMDDNTHSASIKIGTSFPYQVNLNQITNPGTNIITAYLSPDASNSNLNQRILNTSVIVNPTGTYANFIVNVKDALTGGYIFGANASTINPGTGEWKNLTVTNGPVTFQYPKGLLIGYTAIADGYETPYINYLILDQDTTVTVSMTKPTTLPAGYANLNVYVNAANNPVQNALVSLFQGPSKYTGSQGLASFNLSANTNGSLTVSKSGYASVTKIWTCGATTCTNVIVDLIPQTTATTALPSNIPTTSANGTYTGFWAQWYKGLHTMGADNSELPILMAGLITMIFLIIGAAITRDHVGAIAGAAVGFLLSIAFDFIGLVYIIVLLVAGFFLYIVLGR